MHRPIDVVVAEPHQAPLGDAGERSHEARVGGQLRLGLVGGAGPQLEERSLAETSSDAGDRRGEVERFELVGVEAGIAQLEVAPADAVADERRVGTGNVLEQQRHAHVAKLVLVALEGPLEGRILGRVAGDVLAKLLGRQRPRCSEEHVHQGEEPLDLRRHHASPSRSAAPNAPAAPAAAK
ncbi:MAG: hypothetical protein R2701_06225 [Acidimicrobiales bacterium]